LNRCPASRRSNRTCRVRFQGNAANPQVQVVDRAVGCETTGVCCVVSTKGGPVNGEREGRVNIEHQRGHCLGVFADVVSRDDCGGSGNRAAGGVAPIPNRLRCPRVGRTLPVGIFTCLGCRVAFDGDGTVQGCVAVAGVFVVAGHEDDNDLIDPHREIGSCADRRLRGFVRSAAERARKGCWRGFYGEINPLPRGGVDGGVIEVDAARI
jgi:hypothetical protein